MRAVDSCKTHWASWIYTKLNMSQAGNTCKIDIRDPASPEGSVLARERWAAQCLRSSRHALRAHCSGNVQKDVGCDYALGNYMQGSGSTRSITQMPAWCRVWGLAWALCSCFQGDCSHPGLSCRVQPPSEALQPATDLLLAFVSMAGHARLPLTAALGKGALLTCAPPPSGACRQPPCALALGRPASWCRWRESAGRSATKRPSGSCASSAAEQPPAGRRQPEASGRHVVGLGEARPQERWMQQQAA